MPTSSKKPSNPSSKSTSSTSQADQGPGSQGGTGVSPEFAHSYGLKYHDPNDYAEAKAIQQAFRDQDAKQKHGGTLSTGVKTVWVLGVSEA